MTLPPAEAAQQPPCTLLLCRGELLQRQALGPDPCAAARQLHVALMGAALRTRLQHADCALA